MAPGRRMGQRWYNSTLSLPRPLYIAMTVRLHVPTNYPPGKIPLTSNRWRTLGRDFNLDSVVRRKSLISPTVKPQTIKYTELTIPDITVSSTNYKKIALFGVIKGDVRKNKAISQRIPKCPWQGKFIYSVIQKDGTQFRTSIFPELYMVCEWST